jgi:hypothetical protein
MSSEFKPHRFKLTVCKWHKAAGLGARPDSPLSEQQQTLLAVIKTGRL